jgi:hypothetical protein
MFVIFELSQALFMLSKGAMGDYWKGNLAALRALPGMLDKRRAFQKLKVKSDSEWLRSGEIFVPAQLQKGEWMKALLKLYYRVFHQYWQLVRPLS